MTGVVEVPTVTHGFYGTRYGDRQPSVTRGRTYLWHCDTCGQDSFATFPTPAEALDYLDAHHDMYHPATVGELEAVS